MKKTLVLLLLAVAFVSCKSKQSATSTKVDNKSEVALKGNWTISSVTYPGSEVIKVTSFDIADSKCFIGSNWKFVSNNNKGEMALNNAKCTAFASPITWFINNEGKFVLKIINESKAKNVDKGYVLRVAGQTESSFQLIDNMNIGGKMTDVVYQFQRN